jgi:hypothetical protein
MGPQQTPSGQDTKENFMKTIIAVALLLMGISASAQTSKILMFCDYYTPNQVGEIYVDVFLDYDAATNTYSNIEAGILETQNAQYPDYLWALNLVHTPGSAVANVTIERDLDILSFDFPTVATASSPSFAIPKSAEGVIQDFYVTMKGYYLGASVDQQFLCYDPATKEQPNQR